jgi:hypothetical protein
MERKFNNKIIKKKMNLPWFKNVLKSMGHSSTDLVKSMMPATFEVSSTNIDTAKELVQGMTNIRTTLKNLNKHSH